MDTLYQLRHTGDGDDLVLTGTIEEIEAYLREHEPNHSFHFCTTQGPWKVRILPAGSIRPESEQPQ